MESPKYKKFEFNLNLLLEFFNEYIIQYLFKILYIVLKNNSNSLLYLTIILHYLMFINCYHNVPTNCRLNLLYRYCFTYS